MIGKIIAHYQIVQKLGEGGMGLVYKAFDTRLDRYVALKLLRAERIADPERKSRFIQEARAASALSHPNIVQVYEITEAEGIQCIVMEYVLGKTLHQLIGRTGLRLTDALNYAVQIADALTCAHAAGLIHRDLKPSNIMVTPQGLVKLLDFGLAKLTERTETDQDLTETLNDGASERTGAVLGTAQYMSPEQVDGKRLDARSDVFSFGAVMYEMVTGHKAFHGFSRTGDVLPILNREENSASGDSIPRELDKLISRCLRTERDHRLQHMGDVKLMLEDLRREVETDRIDGRSTLSRPRHKWGVVLAITAIVALGAWFVSVAWWSKRTVTRTPGQVLSRLTSASGLTTDPTLSKDGKLLAYASDRAGLGNLDIWMQQVDGGDPIRLTQDEADEYAPVFSPDGTRIAFRSERAGGGIYVVSSLGGAMRLIARQGHRPQFSPDGKWIAYWIGHRGGDLSGKGNSRIYIVSANGATPRQLQPEFDAASYPIWSPDGQHLMFLGNKAAAEGGDWWVTPANGSGVAVKTGIFDIFRKKRFEGLRVPSGWTQQGDVIFSGRFGDSVNIWRIRISPQTFKASSSPQRLTSGTTMEEHPSISSAGTVAFASVIENVDIWSLPIDTNHGRVTGQLQRLTEDAAADFVPTLSPDGTKMVFVSDRSGNQDIWVKELSGGQEEHALTFTAAKESWPSISRDGSKVAFEVFENGKPSIQVIPISGGIARTVCDDCGNPGSWLLDGRRLLYLGRYPARVSLLDTTSGERIGLLDHTRYQLYQPRLSADDQWMSFIATTTTGSQIYIVPFRQAVLSDEHKWIPVTDGRGWDDKPRWSPNGNLIYFTSDRDGFRCIWAQRLDAMSMYPVGSPFPLYHSHSARRSLMNVGLGPLEISLCRDRIVFNMAERSGNIWMTSVEGR